MKTFLLSLPAALALGLLPRAAPAADATVIQRLRQGQGLSAEDLLSLAGPAGWAALALGAFVLLLMLYLLLSLWSGRFAPEALRRGLLERAAAGDLEGLRKLCEDDDASLLARAAQACLSAPAAERAARAEAAGRRLAARWRALVDLLAAAGVIAPLLGLLGTLLGLIQVFAATAAPELSAARVSAGALAALAPAAVGVGVSVLALGAHHLAQSRLAALVADCEAACLEVCAALGGWPAAAVPQFREEPPPPPPQFPPETGVLEAPPEEAMR